MSKEVEVYNTYFGDCIILKDKDDDSNLLVDFGIHCFSEIGNFYGNRDNLHRLIADQIAGHYSSGKISLLITHFHEDHVSGLVDMYKSENIIFKNMFAKVYIANIWDNPFAVASNLLEEMIVEHELKQSGLPRTKNFSFFDLLEFLSVNVYRVHLLKRGDLFENDKYIALWPIIDDRKNYVSVIIQSLGLSKDFESNLIELSKDVCHFVTEKLSGVNDSFEYDNENVTESIQKWRITYEGLLNDLDEHIFMNRENNLLRMQKEKLNKLNHKYNIVFQNSVCDDENVLFTGDIEVKHMKEIANAKDITLFEEYKYIKIPHHGTKRHYFDYSKYNPQNIIITNGKIKAKDVNAYKICRGYGKLNAIHLCTNSNNCVNCAASCRYATSICKRGRKLVFNRLSVTL